MELYILILVEFIFLIITYMLFDKDIMAPPAISNLVLMIGTIFVIPSVELWNLTISWKTIFVISIGLFVINVVALLSKKIFKTKRILKKYETIKLIHCSNSVEHIITFVSIGLTLLYLLDSIRVGSTYGGTGFSAIAYTKMAYLNNSSGVRMNPIIRQGFKIVMLFSYISAFLFSNNVLVLKEKTINNISYLVSIICGCLITLFSGSRTEIIRILSALVLCFSMLDKENNGWKQKDNSQSLLKIVKKFFPILFIVVVMAFASRSIVKVTGTGGTEISSFVSYISFYVGSPIQVLNLKLEYFNGIDELFWGTKSNIPEFVYLGNLDYGGNVATIFGSIFMYNGIIGMVIALTIIFFLGTTFYYKIYYTYTSNRRNLKLIAYSYLYFVFTMSYYADCSLMIFQFSNLSVFLMVLILFKPITRLRITLKG